MGLRAREKRHGVAGIARAMREFLPAWRGYRTEAEEYRELDGESILVLSRDRGRGKQSDVATEQLRASVLLIRDRKVTRLLLYWDRDRALAELGLAPEGDGA
jgi:ketosteroid isomerase-like protein